MPRDAAPVPSVLPVEAYPDPDAILAGLIATAALTEADRARIHAAATDLVARLRSEARPGLMEVFLAEYGLSTDEGIALMCLAEALLRVPDAPTVDALIEDKIAPGDWGRHLGRSSSSLVNASTWALMLTGRVLDDPARRGQNPVRALRGAVRRMGEPVIRRAVGQAMREMGRQFVLGETMASAMDRAARMERRGYTYSYDMLGEAARTARDAERYRAAYADAMDRMARAATHDDIARNPGISVKLSALHPRYEAAQRDRVLAELVPVLADLAAQAARLNIGLNIDAEEADRLSLSLEVIAAVLTDPRLAGWDGFGVVVQAYGPRAGAVIDWLADRAASLDRRLMVRLVKGAYWDTEIKRAQEHGLPRFPVFSRKPATDVSYIANARRLLAARDRLYPQFATHNAHTVAAILDMARTMGADRDSFEFQRLHGMGEALHDIVLRDQGTRCRIYAPVGAHRDLLAYLVRRLLENGANSSFVNQIVDKAVPPETVAADPFALLGHAIQVTPGDALFQPTRPNSRGWDLAAADHLARIDAARDPHRSATFDAAPLLAAEAHPAPAMPVANPGDPSDIVGHVRPASPADAQAALAAARPWDADAATRARILDAAADLYESEFGRIYALLAREAGKTLPDAVGELREAVDFLRYYATQIPDAAPLGTVTCISPWNFPLAIFTGQIAGALAAGNAVLAKPAPQTPLIAHLAVTLLHRAGIPRVALQFLPGGGDLGAALTSDARVAAVAFTGSTATARRIRAAMADHCDPGAPLIAETGGMNAMIVDSTALPEQAVRDVIASAFQSAGQRCSALRCLYVQQDIADDFRAMLFGAMDELRIGPAWDLSTDIGPLIDADAKARIADYLADRPILHRLDAPAQGHYLPPAVVAVQGIADIPFEVFGPVLHLATFRAGQIDRVIDDIDATGYGLTFGLHTRIDDRVQHIADRVRAGNVYVNRNQIGAIVGSQPFGGEGLSGTGPKAGGPFYVPRFAQPVAATPPETPRHLPGPTGELNRLTLHPRAPILCLGPTDDDKARQMADVRRLGGIARDGTAGDLDAAGIGGAVWWGDAATARDMARRLAARDGPILRLVTGEITVPDVLLERHLCVDTTASGGNADLLAQVARDDPAAA
ncbi:bifunctional PutA protein [Oceaniovalibus guishaninsula JLT2003]|uniref:Bifunctional protein PutA n=1 Tax=Oceaniovalibus guishaninsula JLT2003 TaxID=1231392 RepID=K2GMU8_9RHOB|nr:bifunctional proline dehydrogenase/L-glutamate gamma-semialdehyde dehydrogenase PutA [Oceaniovalibus guishaninsula]EKE44026.1 bifunctional PutA protein [Oceaniovalibus guishaninsula JLT2003]